MRKVNKNSKLVLDKLWELSLNNDNHHKLNNDSTYMPLSIEILDEDQISLCHYGELNDDLMRDPEMKFFKDSNGDYYPIYYRNDYIGIEQFTGQIINKRINIQKRKKQASQVEFANLWMNNIKEQQRL